MKIPSGFFKGAIFHFIDFLSIFKLFLKKLFKKFFTGQLQVFAVPNLVSITMVLNNKIGIFAMLTVLTGPITHKFLYVFTYEVNKTE